MSRLEHPQEVLAQLRTALAALSFAHGQAGEAEGDRTNLNGPVRDLIFGINSALGGLVELIEEQSEAVVRMPYCAYPGCPYPDNPAYNHFHPKDYPSDSYPDEPASEDNRQMWRRG